MQQQPPRPHATRRGAGSAFTNQSAEAGASARHGALCRGPRVTRPPAYVAAWSKVVGERPVAVERRAADAECLHDRGHLGRSWSVDEAVNLRYNRRQKVDGLRDHLVVDGGTPRCCLGIVLMDNLIAPVNDQVKPLFQIFDV